MEKLVFSVFEKVIDPKLPVLLAFSGGPDSSCLFHLLLEWKKSHRLDLQLVHVDHGWREESKSEREAIQRQAASVDLPLHWTTLELKKFKGNLEAESRRHRLAYFREVAKQTKAQGVFLGHHQNDQAETVFKRLLEGASLPYLAGMSEKTSIDGLTLIRPLLQVAKGEILAWLEQKQISFFEDTTNSDTRFLRAKMRQVIFPGLAKEFGKEFEGNLCHIAGDAEMLRQYLNMKVAPFLECAVEGRWGCYFDFQKSMPSLYELHYLIRQITTTRGAVFSRSQIGQIAALITENAANKRIISGQYVLECDRGRLFFMKRQEKQLEKQFEDVVELEMGVQTFAGWRVEVSNEPISCKNHFVDAWRGHLQTILPADRYTISFAKPHYRRALGKTTKELSRLLCEKKVPHFLSELVPMICKKELVLEDFLTGFASGEKNSYDAFLAITLKHF